MIEPTWKAGDVMLYLGDCLDILPQLEAGSVDAILTDIPYGTTACAWDEIIPFDPMWSGVKHVLKPRGVFVTTASQPFTSKLIVSNLDWFKYEWVWIKNIPGGFWNAKIMPMKAHENVLVFGHDSNTYNPQMIKRTPEEYRASARFNDSQSRVGESYGGKPINPMIRRSRKEQWHKYPDTTININVEDNRNGDGHPTQKPVALYAYLARTYTNEGDTVCDFTMGSGTTGVACVQTGRKFIGIEIDEKYFEIAVKRISEAQLQMRLPI